MNMFGHEFESRRLHYFECSICKIDLQNAAFFLLLLSLLIRHLLTGSITYQVFRNSCKGHVVKLGIGS